MRLFVLKSQGKSVHVPCPLSGQGCFQALGPFVYRAQADAFRVVRNDGRHAVIGDGQRAMSRFVRLQGEADVRGLAMGQAVGHGFLDDAVDLPCRLLVQPVVVSIVMVGDVRPAAGRHERGVSRQPFVQADALEVRRHQFVRDVSDFLLQPVHDFADFLPVLGIVPSRFDAHLQGQQFVGYAVVQLFGQVFAFFFQPFGIASGGFPLFFFLHALQAAFGGLLLLAEIKQPEYGQEDDGRFATPALWCGI